MPQSAAVPYFFTRYVKQAGALQLLTAVPWHAYARGHDVHRLTRAPFFEMWVKTEHWPVHPRSILDGIIIIEVSSVVKGVIAIAFQKVYVCRSCRRACKALPA